MMYVRYFTQPLSQIAQAAQSLQSAAAAGERVFEFLEAKEMDDESNKTKTLDNVKGDVSFEHVKFGYDEDRVIIHDFSAQAKAGQKLPLSVQRERERQHLSICLCVFMRFRAEKSALMAFRLIR